MGYSWRGEETNAKRTTTMIKKNLSVCLMIKGNHNEKKEVEQRKDEKKGMGLQKETR